MSSRATHFEAQISASTDLSASAAPIAFKYDEVGGDKSGAISKSVKKSSKGQIIVKKSEKPQRPEKLQRSSVRRNVYQSTDPPSIGNEELELLLQLSDSFSNSFCLA